MDFKIAGKVVVVTGATANIGRAIALDYATEGAKLVVVGRDENAGKRVIEKALALGAEAAIFVKADLLDPSAPAIILEEAEQLGPVEILVNNVGGNVDQTLFADSTPETWLDDINITLMTTLRMTHEVLPGMITRKGGRIINIGSTAAIVGDYLLAVYSAAKGAVHSFTTVLAKEVGPHGITVNCIAPDGTISKDPEAFSSGSRFNPENGVFTKTVANADPSAMARRLRHGVLGKTIASPEEISGLAVFLGSEQAGFITGQIMQVDGGSLL